MQSLFSTVLRKILAKISALSMKLESVAAETTQTTFSVQPARTLHVNDTMETKKVYILLILSLAYLTLSLACDPLAFRLIDFIGYPLSASALVYSSLFTLLDLIARITSRNMAIVMLILFHFFDLLFTYILYTANLIPPPKDYTLLAAYNTILTPLPRLFWSGIAGGLIAGIVEVSLYAFLQTKIKNFFIASVSATVIILMAHNIPADYFAFHKIFPDSYPMLITLNFAIGAGLVAVNSFIASLLLKKARFTK